MNEAKYPARKWEGWTEIGGHLYQGVAVGHGNWIVRRTKIDGGWLAQLIEQELTELDPGLSEQKVIQIAIERNGWGMQVSPNHFSK